MKLFSNLVKLSLAPFAVVLGLSEVPLGIRNGFMIPFKSTAIKYDRFNVDDVFGHEVMLEMPLFCITMPQ